MTDIINSISIWFKEKTSSPLYGTYIIFLISWNWKFFYTLFFQDQSALDLPKIEYLQKHFIDNQGLVEHWLWFLIPPIILTYLAIWWMPYVTNRAHLIHAKHYTDRRINYETERVRYEKYKNDALSTVANLKAEQKTSIEKIEDNMTSDEKWDREIEALDIDTLMGIMPRLSETIYGNYHGYYRDARLAPEILATAHSMDLVEFYDNKNAIEFTEKGKYFFKFYQKLIKK